jgi:hypothetical protein
MNKKHKVKKSGAKSTRIIVKEHFNQKGKTIEELMTEIMVNAVKRSTK